MKITHISAKGFLAFRFLELDLQAPINFFIGLNESGKSSIRDMVLWALTGQARGLKTHQEQALLIREGDKAAEVVLTYADESTITRRKTLKSPPTSDGEAPQDAVLAAILCDPFTFFSYPEAQRRELLFRLVPGLNPSPEDIALKLRIFAPDPNYSLSGLATLAATKGFPTAETEAITKRREAKRLRDSLQVNVPASIFSIPGEEGEEAKTFDLSTLPLATIEKELTQVRQERDGLIKQKGKLEGDQTKLANLETELEALVIPDVPREGLIEELHLALDEHRPTLDQLTVECSTLEQGAPAQLFPETCPVHNVPCGSAGLVAIPAVDPSDPEMAAKVRAEHQALGQKINDLWAQVKAAKAGQEAHDKALARQETLTQQIAKIKEDWQTPAEGGASLAQQIERLDGRVTVGEQVLEAAKDYQHQKEAAEAAEAKINEVEQEIGFYHAMAHALAADGIPSQMLSEALGPINKLLSYVCEFLFPCRPLFLTKDLEIVLDGTPLSVLSKSARFRAGVAFQYILAKLSGSRLLMIDEADILDPHNREEFTDFLLKIAPDFDNIFVFATSEHAASSPIPEIQIWWVKDGQVIRLADRAAA